MEAGEREEFQRVFDGGEKFTLAAIVAGLRRDGWDDEAITRYKRFHRAAKERELVTSGAAVPSSASGGAPIDVAREPRFKGPLMFVKSGQPIAAVLQRCMNDPRFSEADVEALRSHLEGNTGIVAASEPEAQPPTALMEPEPQLSKSDVVVLNPAAAFPTAQMTAAMRAIDAKSAVPMIGENVTGAGPDLAADALAGDLGYEILRDMCKASPEKQSTEEGSTSLIVRSRYIDARIMKAHAEGVRQIVLLAAGLDARAWRLPLGGDGCTLFELDVPEALAFKQAKIDAGALAAVYPGGTTCRRVPVAADLSQAEWVGALVAAGFERASPSFFLTEGLLMYLPRDGSVNRLFACVADLMAPGSTYCGDSFAGVLRGPCFQPYTEPAQAVLAKYGTRWTFDLDKGSDLEALLAGVGLELTDHTEAKGLEKALEARRKDLAATTTPVHEVVDEALATHAAELINAGFDSLHSWPEINRIWAVDLITDGDLGIDELLRTMVQKGQNYLGLKEANDATKQRVVQLLKFEHKLTERLPAIVAEQQGGGEIEAISFKDVGYFLFTSIKKSEQVVLEPEPER